ncbi:MAG: thiamine diphosphokinase [Rhodobacter sp.]|uniref:thiamine diphosphokinase n=1 Tax=Pararhodobacter sp. TaxID=2127056 RepID=UPI001D1FF525|nr:thiamine diphosphokinase [Pararhodobacter sp.]MCB1345845.1 thiamine diphosphokinase [Paracoccaceae bacterium]MCC0074845.1 thiamine diphosphokinase [Rhodobacter sp.]HPD90845.1 thiamine diphosphokinase [Pararhodobacter sp.]
MSDPFAKAPGITLVGGGASSAEALTRALARAPRLIAVDGGADAALAMGHLPDLATGDFDSISPRARAALGPDRLRHTPDQEETDFDKALAFVDAPFALAVGFTGARLDHTLAAMSTLLRNPSRRVILDTGHDLCLLCPPRLALSLPRGTRVSLYPTAPMRCDSVGLRWPTSPLHFAPDARIGTSNAATGGPVVLTPDGPSMLLLLPVSELDELLAALAGAPLWPDAAHAR